MVKQNRISIERCRELLTNQKSYSDDEITTQRDLLYRLAEVVIEKFKTLKRQFSSSVVARARIIKN